MLKAIRNFWRPLFEPERIYETAGIDWPTIKAAFDAEDAAILRAHQIESLTKERDRLRRNKKKWSHVQTTIDALKAGDVQS